MYLAFDVGGTKIKGGLIDEHGTLHAQKKKSTCVREGVRGLVRQIVNLSQHLIENSEIDSKSVKGVGVGVPGFVDEKGNLSFAVNLKIRNVSLQTILEKEFDCQVVVMNDADAAALGEYWMGKGQGISNLLCLTIGTGIGAGAIVNGKLHNGKQGFSGELGHTVVREVNGRKCNCGKRGCLESESSGNALSYYARKRVANNETSSLVGVLSNKGIISGGDVIEQANQGDELALSLLDSLGYYVGMVLSNVMLVIEFDRIIIGGGISLGGRVVFDPITKWFREFIIPEYQIDSNDLIQRADLGNNAGIYGLAYYCLTKE